MPPNAPRCCASCCNLCTYVLLTVFHVAMYFSMQAVKHCDSPDDNELLGFGTCPLSVRVVLISAGFNVDDRTRDARISHSSSGLFAFVVSSV